MTGRQRRETVRLGQERKALQALAEPKSLQPALHEEPTLPPMDVAALLAPFQIDPTQPPLYRPAPGPEPDRVYLTFIDGTRKTCRNVEAVEIQPQGVLRIDLMDGYLLCSLVNVIFAEYRPARP